MGFLQQFFRDVFNENQQQQTPAESEKDFGKLSEEMLDLHMKIAKYDDFVLTDAIRPSIDLKVKPVQGYRHDVYHDEEAGNRIPVVMGAASKERLFDLFIQLIGTLGNEVDVVLESSHHHGQSGHVDLYREQIEMPILKSILYDFEDLLLNDGCTGIAVLNPSLPQEVQLDEHKLLIAYGSPLEPFEHLLEVGGVHCNESMSFLTESEHIHSSSEEYLRQFEVLKMKLGIEDNPIDDNDLCF
ncbi:MAG: hypothetical protein MPJ24_06800 [Pirellulaceae bacterium]|nr:hypothetical protein [Pirellulaceae bacterium]